MSLREFGQHRDTQRFDVTAPSASTFEEQESEDKLLTLAFKRGERGAYQAIYDRYSGRVHGVCRRMLLHREDAEEAAQESFLRVYQALGRFNGRYLLGPWITRITTNVCLDHLRAKSRRPVEPVPEEALDVSQPMSEQDELNPERVHFRLAESRRVRRLLASLSPMYRAAIVLRDFEGLSYAEVAAVLEITEPQTKALIHRARQAFKRSWSSALLAAPIRLLHRFRRLDASGPDGGARAPGSVQQASDAMSSVAQVATSCSTVAQSCAHFFVERAAAVSTAVVIGVGAGAALATPARPPQGAEVSLTSSAEGHARPISRAPHRPHRLEDHRPVAPAPSSTPEPVATETDAPPPASEAPATDPDPTPAPPKSEPAAAEEPASTPAPPPSPTPEPQGFAFLFETNRASVGPCSCLRATSIASERVQADSGGLQYVDQVVEGTAMANGVPEYGVWAHQMSQSGGDHSLEFRLFTSEGGYFYSGRGWMIARTPTSWGGWSYTYRGTFHLTSRPSSDLDMPSQGAYTATIVTSSSHSRVLSTSLSLSEGNS